jgi:hypothetical protein
MALAPLLTASANVNLPSRIFVAYTALQISVSAVVADPGSHRVVRLVVVGPVILIKGVGVVVVVVVIVVTAAAHLVGQLCWLWGWRIQKMMDRSGENIMEM